MTIFASRAGSTANATLLAALAVFLLASCGGNDEPPKSDATEDVAMRLAKSEPSVEKFLDGKEIKKVIYKAGKILNIVVPK